FRSFVRARVFQSSSAGPLPRLAVGSSAVSLGPAVRRESAFTLADARYHRCQESALTMWSATAAATMSQNQALTEAAEGDESARSISFRLTASIFRRPAAIASGMDIRSPR